MALIVQTTGVVGTLTAAFIAVRSYVNSNKQAEESRKKEQESRDRDLETRQAQLLMQIYDKVNNKEFVNNYQETTYYWKYSDYNEYFNKYGSKPEEYNRVALVMNTFHGISIILQNKLVSPKMIYDLVGVDFMKAWDKFGPIVKEYSKRSGEPKMTESHDFLYGEMMRIYEAEFGHGFDAKIRGIDDAMSTVTGNAGVS